MAIYALYIRFTDNEERRLATRPVHREYLKALYDAGTMIEAGPFTDDSGALIVYEVESKEAAEAQFAQDPYSITGGIVESVTFHEWNRVFAPRNRTPANVDGRKEDSGHRCERGRNRTQPSRVPIIESGTRHHMRRRPVSAFPIERTWRSHAYCHSL